MSIKLENLIEKRDELVKYLDFLAWKHEITLSESKYYSVTGPLSDIYYSKTIDLIENEFNITRTERDKVNQILLDEHGVK